LTALKSATFSIQAEEFKRKSTSLVANFDFLNHFELITTVEMFGHVRVLSKRGVDKEKSDSFASLGSEATMVEHGGQVIFHILGHVNVHVNDH
jgi:cyclopropane fatty-acyl-phospholipid synthase-like methyltransferase